MQAGGRARQAIFQAIKPGPRLRMAARLYASGAVPTKKAACEAVGLSPNYLTVMNQNPEVKNILAEVDRAINDETVSLSRVIALTARKAARRIGELVDSGNEHVALKASSDILDRTPETSKHFKTTSTSWSLDGKDAKELALALIEGARAKEKYLAIAAGDFVRVDTDKETGNGKEEKEHKEGSEQGDQPREQKSEA